MTQNVHYGSIARNLEQKNDKWDCISYHLTLSYYFTFYCKISHKEIILHEQNQLFTWGHPQTTWSKFLDIYDTPPTHKCEVTFIK